MYLTDLEKGDTVNIIKIHATKELRDRLASFGVMRGEKLSVRSYSLGKNTIEIEVDSTLIALRADEAETIEVEDESNK